MTTENDVSDAMVDAAMSEYRESDLDGRALVRRMLEAALRERVLPPGSSADVWDEGYDAGHQDARAVQPTYPKETLNPYRVIPTESGND